ncbi:hypothetical protein QWZ10_02570 [Paracoccus cavernae]|uniref:Uncharacterized protein n=1 Tax=Paracoccus cavernae TaxID=1571207 RepID=A0ABT8D6U6_9RHOB|nr:hypothetical protein [Paracoccus cavernae]
MDVGREIERLRERIGGGAAMVVRRVRPSKRADADLCTAFRSARIITNRRLVDAVCLDGQSLRGVLEAHGWSTGSKNIVVVKEALAGVLDAMAGCGD